MKRVTLALFLAVAGVAQASFELAFVADNFAVGGSEARIHRYDTVTGTYLGSFGESYHPYADIAVNQSTGRLYALDSSGMLTEYDYSTGLALRARYYFLGNGLNVAPGGSELYVQNGAVVTRVSIATLTSAGSINLSVASGTPRSLTLIGSSLYALCTPATGTWRTVRYDLSGSIVHSSGTLGFSSSPGKIGHITGAAIDWPYYLMTGTGTGASMFYNSVTPSGQLANPGTFTPTIGQLWQDVAPLHVGGAYLGQYGADPTKGVVCVASGTGGVFKSFDTAQLKNPVAIATVVTPEPASLGVLGLGLSLVWRRRRQ